MSHDSRAIANRFLQKAWDASVQVTPMQALKLVYFAHGWRLATAARPLSSSGFYAWKYGPVNKAVYKAFSSFGALPISKPAVDERGRVPTATFNGSEEALMDRVFEIYGRLSGPALSALTHRAGTPWTETWAAGRGEYDLIPDEMIKRYFAESKLGG